MIGTFLLSNNLGNTTCHVGPWIITRDTVLFILQKLNSTILTSWLTSILFFHHTYLDLTVSNVVFVFFAIPTPSMETPRSRQKNWTLRASHSIPPPSFLLFLPFSFWIIAIIQLHHNRKKAPLRPSTVFVQIILPSKRTGVSLKGSRWHWQETVPGEEKVNQLFKTDCNKWHFNRLLKDVQQSIIQFYLQKVTL